MLNDDLFTPYENNNTMSLRSSFPFIYYANVYIDTQN